VVAVVAVVTVVAVAVRGVFYFKLVFQSLRERATQL
jgi:hypothetical protein